MVATINMVHVNLNFKCHGFFCIQVEAEGSGFCQCSSCRWCISCAPTWANAIEKHQGHDTVLDPTTSCPVWHRTWHSLRLHTHQCGTLCILRWMVLWTNLFSPIHPLWPSHQHSTSCCIPSWVDQRGTSLPSRLGSWTPSLGCYPLGTCVPHILSHDVIFWLITIKFR